jgi:hypothetical protein
MLLFCPHLLVCGKINNNMHRPDGKAPGDDGLTNRYYKTFWKQLHGPLLSSLRAGMHGEKGLSDSQTRSVIRLIEKKGKDKTVIKGW